VSFDRLADMCEAAKFNMNGDENIALNHSDNELFYHIMDKIEE
jgi:hypothetical protein